MTSPTSPLIKFQGVAFDYELGHEVLHGINLEINRGDEMDNLKGGIVARIQRFAPLIIPVVMQSTVTGEEVIDAMHLRAFGTTPRTWLKNLKYAPRDYIMIALGVGIFVTCCVLKWGFGIGGSLCRTSLQIYWLDRENKPPLEKAAVCFIFHAGRFRQPSP